MNNEKHVLNRQSWETPKLVDLSTANTQAGNPSTSEYTVIVRTINGRERSRVYYGPTVNPGS